MNKLFDSKLLSIKVPVDTWQQALSVSCAKLIEHEYVTDKYLDLLIDVVHQVGPYFILLENFALPHVSASEEVIKTGVSITTLDKPVKFDNGKQVSVLFTLATVDNQEHLGMLSQLSELLLRDDFVTKLAAANTEEQIQKIMEESWK